MDGTKADLYSLNLTTAAATDLGSTGVFGLNGLVVVAEPGTVGLAVVGLV